MTVGFFAPMPPARTGVADYALHLLNALRTYGRVELAPARASVNLYHIGNNQLHARIYERALREPGVVVLHDAVLHHFSLGYFGREEYIGEFAYNYGDWHRELASDLWQRRAQSAADKRYFEFPMLRRLCETARAVIVHNPAAARIVRTHAPEARVFEIPHLLFPVSAPDAADVLAFRKRLGILPRELLCGVFGYLRESKRVRTVIEACRRANIRLLIAGAGSPDLEKALAPSLRQDGVIRFGHTDAREFHMLAWSVDACVNLRYPSAGETSGISVMLMGASKPVLITAAEENSRFPEDACIRIEPGLAEQSHLTLALGWLKEFPSHRRLLGASAAEYIRREHAPARVAGLYWSALRAA